MRRFTCSRCADPGVHDGAISAEAKHEEVTYEPPKTIIARLRALEAEIARDLNELEAML